MDLSSQIQLLLHQLEQAHNRALLNAQPDNRRNSTHHRLNRSLERGRAQAYNDAAKLVRHYLVTNLQIQPSSQSGQGIFEE